MGVQKVLEYYGHTASSCSVLCIALSINTISTPHNYDCTHACMTGGLIPVTD